MGMVTMLIGIPAVGSLLLVVISLTCLECTRDWRYVVPAAAGMLSGFGAFSLLSTYPMLAGNAWTPTVWFTAGILALLAVYAHHVTRTA